jgi:diguanylate cyclase (GGDEF)-like protein
MNPWESLQRRVTSADGTSHMTGASESIVRIPLVRRFPDAAPLMVGALLATGIAALDLATDPALSFGLWYVLVVITATWLGRRRHGLLIAGLASAESLLAAVGDNRTLTPTDVWNASTRLVVLVVVAGLLDALRRALIHQRQHATTDDLTGAMNRRSFGLIAERERLRAGRDGAPLTLAYFDVDRLKEHNDVHGHQAGDELLAAFASAVEDSVRGTDVFTRIGGDEFAILLPQTDARDATVIVDRVRRLLGDIAPGDTRMTTSVGVATFRFPPSTVDGMLAEADRLMYRAKAAGGDTMVGMVFVGPWSRWSQTMADNQPTLAG